MVCVQHPRLLEHGICVDTFTHSITLLTHAHSDHYRGLTRKYRGTVVCTRATYALLQCVEQGKTSSELVEFKLLDSGLLSTEVIAGATVYALDAGHCAGSCMFVIDIQGDRLLYTGDFRFRPPSPDERRLLSSVNYLYYDDTFDNGVTLPSDNDTLQSLTEVVHSSVGDLYIHVSILGFESILDRTGLSFRLSHSLSEGRVCQLRHLLGHKLDDTSRIVLGDMHRVTDTSSRHWVVPSTVFFLCLYQYHDGPYLHVQDAYHTRLWFSTHAGTSEINKLRALCAASCSTNSTACGYRPLLKCIKNP